MLHAQGEDQSGHKRNLLKIFSFSELQSCHKTTDSNVGFDRDVGKGFSLISQLL